MATFFFISISPNDIVTKVYGGKGVVLSQSAKEKIKFINDNKFSNLPVIFAKTQFSLSDDKNKVGAPKDFEIFVRDIELKTGCGFIVAIAGDMMLMPGLSKVPNAEKINILNASLKAMNIACTSVIDKIGENNTLTLVDGNKLIRNYFYPQEFLIKGDSKSASIAAASILAKVSRDRYMERLHEEYPMYNWKKNAGYLTAEHLRAIDEFGITKYHRPSFLKKHFENK